MTLIAIPEETSCSFVDASRKNTNSQAQHSDQVTVNIKHTFIEFGVRPVKPQRTRSFSAGDLILSKDSTCLSELSDASTGVVSDEDEQEVVEVQQAAEWASPCWGPAEDLYYPSTMSDQVLLPLPPAEMMADDAFAHYFSTGYGYSWGMMQDNSTWGQPYSFDPSLADTLPFELSPPYTGTGAKSGLATSSKSSLGKVSWHDMSQQTIDEVVEAPKTTVMLRNLPPMYTRSALIELLEDEGFEGSYDVVYVPMNFSEQCCLGYAFVNFFSEADAGRCWETFDGFCEWGSSSDVVCEVMWSHPHQGVDALIERYRNSPVMHESMPEEWKPAYFVEGVQRPFPAPTINVKAPKAKASRRNTRTKDYQ